MSIVSFGCNRDKLKWWLRGDTFVIRSDIVLKNKAKFENLLLKDQMLIKETVLQIFNSKVKVSI